MNKNKENKSLKVEDRASIARDEGERNTVYVEA
jgi:hypothetical protein